MTTGTYDYITHEEDLPDLYYVVDPTDWNQWPVGSTLDRDKAHDGARNCRGTVVRSSHGGNGPARVEAVYR